MATPPTRIDFQETARNTTTTPKTTAAVSVQPGDILRVFFESEKDTVTGSTPTNSGTALTWSLLQSVVVSNFCWAGVWTATATASESITITLARGATSGKFGGSVAVWRGSDGVGASSKTNNASGAPTLNITTTQANSAIDIAVADFNAADGTTRTWRTVNGSPATEDSYMRDSTAYTNYEGNHPDAGAINTYAVGLSAPGALKYSELAVEIKGAAAAAATSLLVPSFRDTSSLYRR